MTINQATPNARPKGPLVTARALRAFKPLAACSELLLADQRTSGPAG